MIDANLKAYANSEAQVAAIDAVIEHGTVMKAARALGKHHKSIQSAIQRVEARAARSGYAPGHFDQGVAPGYIMGKVTIHRDATGMIKNTWERQSPDDEQREIAMQAAFKAMAAELPRVPVKPNPLAGLLNDNLLNMFTVSDYHMGMLAWDKEAGADWDISIAEDLLYRAFESLIQSAPQAKIAILNQLGDFLHFDGMKALTPEHGNLLDADTRFPKLVSAVIRVLRRIVDMLLETHDLVHVVMAEGNHDPVSSIWLRQMFAALYENEPRLTVDTSPFPYYVYKFGKTMLGFHHGHLSKNESLPMLYADKFDEIWGTTKKRYIHTGHRHHELTKEFPGVKIIQHPTMAAADAFAARGGWSSERQMSRITYHSSFGKSGEEIVTPEMFEAVDD